MKISKKITLFFVCICYSCICSSAEANYESTDTLKEMAKNFLLKTIELSPNETMDIKINASDVPARLIKCNQPIDMKIPIGSSRERINAVELSCHDATSWHSYVPVNIQIFTKVVVAKYPIANGARISEEDVDYSQTSINRLYNGYFTDKSMLNGLIAAQSISAGSILTKSNISQPKLVKKNQPIDLVARKNSIEVKMTAIAKSDGALNEAIIVYNPSSKKTIDAIVIGSGQATVI